MTSQYIVSQRDSTQDDALGTVGRLLVSGVGMCVFMQGHWQPSQGKLGEGE